MKTKTLLLFAVLLLTAQALFAWETVLINDMATVRADVGRVCKVTRNTADLHGGTNLYSQSQTPIIHFQVPANIGQMETVMLDGAYFTRRNPPCTNADTVAGTWYWAFSFYADGIDSVEDRVSDPIDSADVIIPPTGTTPRTFYSSLSRLQHNHWDHFLPNLVNDFQAGSWVVLRFVPRIQSGVSINASQISMKVSTDADAEAWGLDWGDPLVQYLGNDSTCLNGYHGLVICVNRVERTPWTSERLQLNFTYNLNLEPFSSRFIMPAWTNENQTIGKIYLGLPMSYIQQHPRMYYYANSYWTIPEGIKCRGETVVTKMQP
jgi:hypothetical protein